MMSGLAASDNPSSLVNLAEGKEEHLTEEGLRCTMCKRFPLFPPKSVWMCWGKHPSCSSCARLMMKYKKCTKHIPPAPVCQEGLMKIVIGDCYGILANSKFECGYGCGAIEKGSDLGTHLLTSCSMRFSASCVASRCSSRQFRGVGFWKHFQKKHPDEITQSTSQYFPIVYLKSDCWADGFRLIQDDLCTVLCVMEAHGEKFVIAGQEFPTQIGFFGFVLNRKAIAEKFQFSMKVKTAPLTKWNVFHCKGKPNPDALKNYAGTNFVLFVEKKALVEEGGSVYVPPVKDRNLFDACHVKFSVVEKGYFPLR